VLHARGPNWPLECIQPSTRAVRSVRGGPRQCPTYRIQSRGENLQVRSVLQVAISERQPAFASEICCVFAHSKLLRLTPLRQRIDRTLLRSESLPSQIVCVQ
jgi:hypothetical protein